MQVLILCRAFVLAKYANPERGFSEYAQKQKKRARPGGAERVKHNREGQEKEGNEMSFHGQFCNGPNGLSAQLSDSIENTIPVIFHPWSVFRKLKLSMPQWLNSPST